MSGGERWDEDRGEEVEKGEREEREEKEAESGVDTTIALPG